MRTDYQTLSSGLDQLIFSPLIEDETIEERADTIRVYLRSNGWTWESVLEYICNENTCSE